MFQLYRSPLPAALTDRWQARWEANQAAIKGFDHPQLHLRWLALVATVRPATELAVWRIPSTGDCFFAFERRKPKHAVPIGGILTDRHAILTPPAGLPAAGVLELLRHCGLETWSFDHLPSIQSALQPFTNQIDPAYTIRLPQGADKYFEQLAVRHRNWCEQQRRKRRKLERELGTLRFELHQADPHALQALIDWKEQQLIRQGIYNCYREGWVRELLYQTMQTQSEGFSGCLSCLYAGDELIATLLGQRSGTVFNAWIPSYQPSRGSYSPGTILQLELIRKLAAEGIQQIDLGRGHNPLKAKLANHLDHLAIGIVDRRPWRNRVRKFLRRSIHAWEATYLGSSTLNISRKMKHRFRNARFQASDG